ncbi:Bax inhibitor-1/YccA family protein [Candidatus Paracaedibacter symbiosus]|uniref:Bax inhibitor-1/YccA family protein n=1 Tax=Candidatus Paracaedibacter symbiosus TaxID=244582 RepID=UPI0005098445|nr:Bax inhibitor-1/YccA family protein [Candidatus Paracaedibacter symbiosus]
MENPYGNKTVIRQGHGQATQLDSGLRSYMQSVFNLMALGLALTGFIAFAAAQSPELVHILYMTPLKWVVLLAPVGVVFYLSYQIQNLSQSTAQLLFWVYSGLMGLSLGTIFLLYTSQSITRVFFITAAMFLSMSLYGYTTKKDLTSMGSFMIMGLFGIVIASLVNIFLQSTGLQFVVSVLGVVIFTGLTAYDVQKIKDAYYSSAAGETIGKVAIMGALTLYLDFINLFMSLLRLFGDRR